MESSVSVITSPVTDLTVNSVQDPIMGNASVVSQGYILSWRNFPPHFENHFTIALAFLDLFPEL